MESIINKLYSIGIVPVVKIDDIDTAVPIAKALCDGGIPCIEVTFRTAHAKEAMAKIKQECPQMLIGAGTITSKEQVDEAISSGAEFMVSAGLNPNTVKYCNEKNIPIFPGCSNASDIEMAIELGLTNVKFFPAENSGGLKMIKALAAPYVNINFMPTGGISDNNITDYLAYDRIIACGASYLVPEEAVKNKDYAKITEICKSTIKTILGLKVVHIGVNTQNEDEANKTSAQLSDLLKAPIKNTPASNFVGEIEIMKGMGRGTHGHMALATKNLARTIAYFSSIGCEFEEGSMQSNKEGRPMVIYFKEEIGGFRYHLLQQD